MVLGITDEKNINSHNRMLRVLLGTWNDVILGWDFDFSHFSPDLSVHTYESYSTFLSEVTVTNLGRCRRSFWRSFVWFSLRYILGKVKQLFPCVYYLVFFSGSSGHFFNLVQVFYGQFNSTNFCSVNKMKTNISTTAKEKYLSNMGQSLALSSGLLELHAFR